MDSLLEPYLAASGEDAERLLEELLVSRAKPRIREIISRKLGPECPDIDDVCADVLVDTAEQLRVWKLSSVECRVDSFLNYVAVCSFNQASEYLRRKYPRWRRLRDRIHYLVRQDPRLAVWQSARGWLCGLRRWNGQDSVAPAPSATLCDVPRGAAAADSLHAILAISDGPLELDAVVGLAAQAWGEPLDHDPVLPSEQSVVPQFEDRIDQRRYAERLWREILLIPARQRQALLLNLKPEGLDVLLLFGVVSFRSLASALAMSPQDFASLWNKLPLNDLSIAELLDCTRQRVINLRKSARKRLANRMRANKQGRFASLTKG